MEHPAHQNIGVLALFVDIHSGMSAQKSGNLDLNHGSLCLLTFYRAHTLYPQAAGAAYCRDSFVLGIHINHGSGADQRFIQRFGTI